MIEEIRKLQEGLIVGLCTEIKGSKGERIEICDVRSS